MKNLREILLKNIDKHEHEIKKNINLFEKGDSNYRNLKIGENLVLVLRKNNCENFIHLGFPFPIESYPIKKFNENENISVSLFLRGDILRSFQRNQLIAETKEIGKVNYIEIDSLEEYRNLTKNICSKFKSVEYYDPYSFLGDSFIGLYFIENFIENFKLELNKIYSENYKNLEIVSDTSGYIGYKNKNKNSLGIFVDLLDNQWNRTKHLVKISTKQGIPSIICGRDIIIIPRKNNIDIYHFNRSDVLLENENIEDYMRRCLSPFLECKSKKVEPIKINSQNIIINPFGSEELKTIPYQLVLEVAKDFKNKNPDSKILLVSGFKNNYSHLLWVSKLKGLLSENGISNVLFKNYGSFLEIEKDIDRYNISIGLTADTSIAHLFNHLNLRNLTFFNLSRCDLQSPQSLSSDSPLGFCRYGKIQYPALIHPRITSLTEGTIGFLDYFLRDANSSWCSLVFNKDILMSKIDIKKNSRLSLSNTKLNPEEKIKND
ncbi:MAG: hypothetical protein OEL89_02895 [Candidatus Peregrinibacteria bacterium]|nr:hypothetical protein [Candidatus Peregrinibacteria bacterium]